MTDLSPAMRAAQLKDDLDALADAIGEDGARRVLAGVPAESMAAIENATRVDWLPIEVDLQIVEVVAGALGEDGLRRWGHDAVMRSASRPIFKPLIDTAVRLFGLSPATLLKVTPQAWRAVFRSCGELAVDRAATGAVALVLRNPPPVLRQRAFLVSIAGSLSAIFTIARTGGGRVDVTIPANGGDPRFDATWPVD